MLDPVGVQSTGAGCKSGGWHVHDSLHNLIAQRKALPATNTLDGRIVSERIQTCIRSQQRNKHKARIGHILKEDDSFSTYQRHQDCEAQGSCDIHAVF
eukprot:7286991-Pyramimonas_sp.AAC.1